MPSGILKTELMIWWYMSNNSHQTIIIIITYILWGCSICSSVRDERNFLQLIKAHLLNLQSGCSFHNFLSADFPSSHSSLIFNFSCIHFFQLFFAFLCALTSHTSSLLYFVLICNLFFWYLGYLLLFFLLLALCEGRWI